MSNLDLEIKKALNNKLDLNKFILFTVKVDVETKIDFRINKNPNNQLTIIANYDQELEHTKHTHKNVTITYYSWNDEDITIQYETQRIINKTDKLEPIVKEMIQEIIDTKNKHMPN